MSRERLFLIDGNNHLFRAFFAIRNMTRSDGMATNAIYGFTAMLKKLLADEKPEYLAVCFDISKSKHRTEAYPEYKANRPPMPEDMRPQIPLIKDVVRGHGIPVLELDGWEADDLIATLARRAEAAGKAAVLVSTDKDLTQLVSEHITMLDTRKDRKLGLAEVIDKMGVPPEKVVDAQGLMGDSTDNIPGVPGIGPKTAAKLIADYGDLEGVYAHIEEIKGKRKENLIAHKDDAFLSRELARLTTDVPVDVEWADLRVSTPDHAALRALFESLEFRTWTREHGSAANSGSDAASGEGDDDTAQDDDAPAAAKLSRDGDTLVASAEALSWMIDALKASAETGGFAFDTETTGLDPLTDKLVGLSFAVGTDASWYVPVGHVLSDEDKQAGRTQLSWPDEVRPALAPILEDAAQPKFAQNAKFDVQVLASHGVDVAGVAFDPMLASYLLDAEQRGHGLDALAERWLQHTTIHFDDLLPKTKKKRGKKGETADMFAPEPTFANVPLGDAVAYACEDAQVVAALHARMAPQLAEEGLEDLLRDLELPLSMVLARMESRGICVDRDKLAALSKDFGERAEALTAACHELAGREFNVGSPKQLGEILFDELELPVKKRTKTGPSTDSSVLEQLADLHELPAKVLEWRSLTKLKGTYTDVLPTLIHKETGRIHTSFHQAVAATGRLSSSDPNLQNIPIRSADGERIRACFVAAPGHVLLSADYSQIELRVLAHLCGDEAMRQAFIDGADVHARTAALLEGVDESEITRGQRAMAKSVNFGILYGMSASRLAREQKLSYGEAKAFIARYFERFPAIERWKERTLEEARERGFTRTIMGRVRKLPDLNSRSRMARNAAERVAVNTPIQGSAADIIKVAMVQLAARLEAEMPDVKLLLQVHDELVLEVPDGQVEAAKALLKGVMESAVALDVPLDVQVGVGGDWLAAH